MNRNIKYNGLLSCIGVWALLFLFTACDEKEYAIPAAKTELQNDVIKRSLGPNVAGLDIEFAYAMALGYGKGKITRATVEASIPGAPGTYMDHRSYHTNSSGIDVGIEVGMPSATEGGRTTVNFTADTAAATLRYFYIIPEEAKGKSVTFTFSAEASTGEKVSYYMGPYEIAKMDMKRLLTVVDSSACYISIADMAVLTPEQAAANPQKVDLIYLYRNVPNIMFNHSMVSPTTNAEYLRGAVIPSGASNNTKIRKEWNVRDRHLADLQFGIYVDDLDFEKLDVSQAPNYALNLRAESGAWVETADGKYRAYIYINSVNNNNKSAVISMKRYAL